MSHLQPRDERHQGTTSEYSWPRLRIRQRQLLGGRLLLQEKTHFVESRNREPWRVTRAFSLRLGARAWGGRYARDLIRR